MRRFWKIVSRETIEARAGKTKCMTQIIVSRETISAVVYIFIPTSPQGSQKTRLNLFSTGKGLNLRLNLIDPYPNQYCCYTCWQVALTRCKLFVFV